jgi:uncharacterized protein YbcI
MSADEQSGSERAPAEGERGELVVVANRLPVHRADGGWETSPGGLVSALMPILQRRKGVWVGWAGTASGDLAPFTHDGLSNVPVPLSEEEVRDYYEGFSNSTLWPLYHDACQQPQFHRHWWRPYVAVNERFAEIAAREAAPGANVLIQDYHLQLVPGMLRQARPDLRIGFFLHIPFPPVELFAQLPWRQRILEGLLGADVIGFQSKAGAQNFIRLVNRYTPYRGVSQSIDVEGRSVQVREFPISIDYEKIDRLAAAPGTIERARAIRARGLAHAAGTFELAVLGRTPSFVAVVNGGTLTMITLQFPLTPMERQIGATASGQQRIKSWHQSLASATFEAFREHLRAVSGFHLRSLATTIDLAGGSLLKTYTTGGSIDLIHLDGQVPGFGISVVDHWHVNDGDGIGSVCRELFPKGIDNRKRVPDAGFDQEEP